MKRPTLKREIKFAFIALLIALGIRIFIAQPFLIPSSSMYPNLHIGDLILASKYQYGYSNYSFPLAPQLFEDRFLNFKKPQRGQVIVFRNPKANTKGILKKLLFQDKSVDFVKRLIGLPGDHIQLKKGILHINGTPVGLKIIGDYTYHDHRSQKDITLTEYEETLPGGPSYHILKEYPFGLGKLDNTPEYIIPEGHYFFMGDNRDNSVDSRVIGSLGVVPESHLIGDVKMILLNLGTMPPF